MMKAFIALNHKWFESIVISGAALTLSFSDIESVLKIFSLLMAIGYTSWKWFQEWYKSRNNGNT